MKNKTKTINANERNSDAIKKMKSFNKRWNISLDSSDRNGFKNRCLNIIQETFDTIYEYGKRHFEIKNYCNKTIIELGFKRLENDPSYFNDTYLYNELSKLNIDNDDNFYKFIYSVENFLNCDFCYLEKYVVKDMAKRIAEALALSNINIKVYQCNGAYQLYPSNIEFLDDKLIVDNLNWLDEYPEVKKHYQIALRKRRTKEEYRNIIDELRLSIELFFKKQFNNKKSLENQLNNIGTYLKDNGIASEICNMYVKLLDYYCLYNNSSAKHGDDVAEIEIDYIIYLTGTFLFLILQIEKSKSLL